MPRSDNTVQVAVLLATYNNEAFLPALLDSLERQTFREFTVLIRDDGSSDDSVLIAERYAKRDDRFQILDIKTKCRGARDNFFALLSKSDQDYVFFADADDVWMKDKIERSLAAMHTAERLHGHAPILLHTDLAVVREDLSPLAPSFFRFAGLSPERISLKHLLVQNVVTGCTVLINRPLRELVRGGEDAVMHDWWLALIAAAFGRIELLFEPTLLYRQHGKNQIGATDASDYMAAVRKLREPGRMRKTYDAMYRQASSFAELYRDKLTFAQFEQAKRFGEMETMSKPARMLRILKEGYGKNTMLRNLGQLISA